MEAVQNLNSLSVKSSPSPQSASEGKDPDMESVCSNAASRVEIERLLEGVPSDDTKNAVSRTDLPPLYQDVERGELLCDNYEALEYRASSYRTSAILCRDVRSNRTVILKMFKDITGHYERDHERVIMDIVSDARGVQTGRFARLMDSVDHGIRPCLVFEAYGMTLKELQSVPYMRPFSFRHLQEWTIQLAEGISFLHSNGIIHTDIKLENIVVESNNAVNIYGFCHTSKFSLKTILVSSAIRIIDLGGAALMTERHAYLSGTPLYRAPEVTLKMEWGYAVDTFGAGLVIAEMFGGSPLFYEVDDNMERLAAMERMLGPFPKKFAMEIERTNKGVFRKSGTAWHVDYPQARCIHRPDHEHIVGRLARLRPLDVMIGYAPLCSLIRRMINVNPESRIPIQEVAQHPFCAAQYTF
ncbi:kinase-like protein [Heliocybe sulcata]|uniref:Kinase-like protein n=1 Tax=Heliocybe sulcata TaxID=5364 RepID=A0A5C3NTC9_9AGAM|nr:kinase-like protein [Heliocybe sulcata]